MIIVPLDVTPLFLMAAALAYSGLVVVLAARR